MYENTDYLEKLYSTVFLPQVHVSGSYGEYPGNLDLGLSRIFTKPYDIYDFITDDKQAIVDNNFIIPSGSLPINSSATEILISNDDCSVELNPSNVNNLNIENNKNYERRLGDCNRDNVRNGFFCDQSVMYYSRFCTWLHDRVKCLRNEDGKVRSLILA